jgi:hypothetical protein
LFLRAGIGQKCRRRKKSPGFSRGLFYGKKGRVFVNWCVAAAAAKRDTEIEISTGRSLLCAENGIQAALLEVDL